MDKYKANRNEDSENNLQNKEEKDLKSTENIVNAGLDVVERIPVASMYAKAAKMANKLTGGAVTKKASNLFNKGMKHAPLGNQMQGLINKASDSGATDAISKTGNLKSATSSLSNTGISSKTNPISKTNNLFSSGNNKNSKANGDISKQLLNAIPKSLKIKIVVGLCVFLLFMMMVYAVMAQDDLYNLMLTNNENISSSDSTRKCSAEEVENKLIYVGDSRIVGLKSSLENEKIEYIAETGQGYDWFVNSAIANIESKISENPDAVIVLALGINDLSNIDSYITTYKDLINKYPDTIFYVLSLNPVDEDKTISNGYTITNSEIEVFNKELSTNFSSNYIDSYSGLTNVNTTDGLHYDNDTNIALNDFVTNNISNSGKVLCKSFGGGDFTSCALTIKDGFYYKTVVPQTDDCNVDAFEGNSWGLEPSFHDNILTLIEDAKAQGCSAVIISGHRSYEKQKQLYNLYRNQPGRAAVPGYSNHQYGIAADLSFSPHSSKCVSYYHNNAKNYGLTFPLVHASFPEDWHIEPINIKRGTPE